MPEQSEQLSMWTSQPVVDVALSLKAAKLNPDQRPVRDYGGIRPGQRVYFVVEGHYDAKLVEDDTDAGRTVFASVTVDRFVDIDASTALELIDEGQEAINEALRRRMAVPLESVAS